MQKHFLAGELVGAILAVVADLPPTAHARHRPFESLASSACSTVILLLLIVCFVTLLLRPDTRQLIPLRC